MQEENNVIKNKENMNGNIFSVFEKREI